MPYPNFKYKKVLQEAAVRKAIQPSAEGRRNYAPADQPPANRKIHRHSPPDIPPLSEYQPRFRRGFHFGNKAKARGRHFRAETNPIAFDARGGRSAKGGKPIEQLLSHATLVILEHR